ncbi:hypothetical protein JG687_00009861 [Phytophthora cactorum]|uniref:Uncharacterized protein n=1 Tax=Phytophthora cactorum TaxID=29920 RepID=A0A329SAK6_9STRA|nr:hypothetical protein PC112_g16300 [Phytophthora cactorum]KAG3015536.1 hypothetical protein PC120_g12078 [Phytophthora cactorum]KAG3060556.1 hypothetical protein PC121_g13398 [Phytophthora cactorum]KAG3141396.1 hypothetical protein C6341_g19767 [Phytophthora cactorum]KAG3219073.1 hypothetical protein PC129_g10109 [Phytophthora cactorum]
MGSLLSISSSSPPPAEQKRILGATENTKSPTAASTEPLFLDEVKAKPATWSDESLCRTIQRFLGLLPDSPGEVIKKEQQHPLFRSRSTASVFNVGNRMGAIIVIQRLYRRYLRLRIWHQVSDQMVQIAHGRLAALRAQEQENISSASFRLLLVEGFSASKVCISGALKTIQLRLVLNTEAGECYLTWTPSRKKKPRINLHDIEQVIVVKKEGNPEAPRLSKKVSYRRGIILVCKSYHRGRVVLEVATKRERNILLQGFQQLLSDMISTEPTLDDLGALRNQHPRRQSVIEFFSSSEEPQSSPVSDVSTNVDVSSSSPRRGSVAVYRPEALAPPLSEYSGESPVQEKEIADSVRADAKAIEHFYQTRFDDSPDNAISLPSQSSRPSRTMEARH